MSCIFCNIVKKQVPCFKILETEHALAFLDIFPLSPGHTLVVPKVHVEKLHQIEDPAILQDIMVLTHSVADRLVSKLGATEYNILQNNGRSAHQEIDHVHFHVIPKPQDNLTLGLSIQWPSKAADMSDLAALQSKLNL